MESPRTRAGPRSRTSTAKRPPVSPRREQERSVTTHPLGTQPRRMTSTRRASSIVSLMGLGESTEPHTHDNAQEETYEFGELERLQRLEREIGTRIGHTLRAIYRPNLASESTVLRLVDMEWRARRDLLQEEEAGRRQASAKEYLAFKVAKETNRMYTERRDTVGEVQNRIAMTLRQITTRRERLIESRDVESEVTRRANINAPPATKVVTPYDDMIPQWQEEGRRAIEARQKQVKALLEGTRPQNSTGTAGFAGLVEIGRFKALMTRKQELAQLRNELKLLEAEQMQSELVHSKQVLQRITIGTDYTLELSANGTIEVHWLSKRCTLRNKIQYNQSSGEILGANDFVMQIPDRRRRADVDNIREMCLKGNMKFEVITEDTALMHDTDERPLISEAPHNLLEYALTYRCPGLHAGVPSPPASPGARPPRSAYLPIALRNAVSIATAYLTEHDIAQLRLVNHDFQRLALDSVALTTRRLEYLISLIEQCGMRFTPMVKMPGKVGYTRIEDLASPRVRGRAKDAKNHVTHKGLGDEACCYPAEERYTEEDDVLVSDRPVTVGQWREIAARFPHVAHLVREEDLELMKYNTIAPSKYRNVHLIRKDDADYTDWDACELELPYQTCAKIAASLGASIPTWMQWEVMARGHDGQQYPWGNDTPTEASVCLEMIPYSMLVPNSRRGQASGNGYVELAEVDVQSCGMARVSQLPVEAGIQGKSSSTRPSLGAIRRDKPGQNLSVEPPVVDSLSSLMDPQKPGAGSRRGQPSLSPMSKFRNVKTLAVKQLRAGIRAHAAGQAEGGVDTLANKMTAEQRIMKLRNIAKTTYQMRRGVMCFESTKNKGQSTAAILAERLDRILATQPKSQTPFRRFARLGKEWNVVARELSLPQLPEPVVDYCLRSLSDLYSMQDVNRNTASLPRPFYASNHRCYSGPPAFCLAPPPPVVPRSLRMRLITHPIKEYAEEILGDDTPRRGTACPAVQIRMKGRGLNREHDPNGQQIMLPAPERASFRLIFAPYNHGQPHPCRPQQRRCFNCKRPYHYTPRCPACFPVRDPLPPPERRAQVAASDAVVTDAFAQPAPQSCP
eukprot:TRINITY_DN16627_c0_g1_i1.p1 TRINITY_DN16627_c0_g1~~TRINITY_DN16627_c0_g1_i1.p1  ORF type:complete len:1079 (+),score=258.63 TRINITY_DN16627_c0_g1_i1:110-3346(+)